MKIYVKAHESLLENEDKEKLDGSHDLSSGPCTAEVLISELGLKSNLIGMTFVNGRYENRDIILKEGDLVEFCRLLHRSEVKA